MPTACERVSAGRRFSAGFGGHAAVDPLDLFLGKLNLPALIHYSV
jgi:hypothetical protein